MNTIDASSVYPTIVLTIGDWKEGIREIGGGSVRHNRDFGFNYVYPRQNLRQSFLLSRPEEVVQSVYPE